MILKPFLRYFEIRNASSSQIGCEFEFDFCILISSASVLSFFYSFSSLLAVLSSAISVWCSTIFVTNSLSRDAANTYLSMMDASERNYGRRTDLTRTQSWSFFERDRLPIAAWRSTSVMRGWISLLVLAKACSAPREITIGDLRGTCKGKGGDNFPEGLVPNGHMCKGQLDPARHISLGEYHDIR